MTMASGRRWFLRGFVAALFTGGLAAADVSAQSARDQQAQRTTGGAQGAATAGVNTGSPHAAVFDAQHRPITAGGFVKSGEIIFADASASSGLTSFHHIMGTPEKRFIIESLGSGVGLLDFDGDGWLDIYLVNGSTYNALAGKTTPPHAALFRNNHDGTFTDVSARAGVQNDRWGIGVAVADFDNDGWPDLYITNYGKNRLYRNNHNGTFTDVTEKAGVALGNWSTGATWGDFDGDGRLDLFVPGYVHYVMTDAPAQAGHDATYSFCEFRGVKVMCGPRGLKGEDDHLFHNNGDGTFTDVSLAAGVSDKALNYGLASLFVDVNNDGKIDLLVADDSTPNYLYLNKGDRTFEDASFASGYAFNGGGRETASMGIAAGDTTHNGRLDLFNTTFSDDYKPFYRNDGSASFTDSSSQMGIAEPTVPFLGWGTGFFDYDNDGWLDLLEVNGHVYPQVDEQNWGTSWKQRPLLFHNVGGKLTLVAAVEGSGLAVLGVARGAAFGDLFNDGKIDVVINNLDGTPTLLRNVTHTGYHWIELQLAGRDHGTPKDAVGTAVYVKANGFTQRADVVSGGSFASSSDKRLHFGLGTATSIESIEIHWSGGKVETITLPGLDGIYTVVQGTGIGKKQNFSRVAICCAD